MTRRVAVALMLGIAVATPAAADLYSSDKFVAYGDFRLRLETDWDSQDQVGIPRDDRTRLRARLRVGFRFDPTEHWRLEMRLRTGSEASQQSPNVTLLDFDHNDTGNISFDFDRWYLRGKQGGFEAWAGRNDLPFWKQDELLFDDDVTMPGVAVTWKSGSGVVSASAGYFAMPVGMKQTAGDLVGAQVAYQPQVGGVHLTFALGGYWFDADPDDPDIVGLLQGNGARDYRIVAANVQARWSAGGRPLVLGADAMRNIEDYDPNAPDPITAQNHDQTDGYVLLATYGGLAKRNDWLIGYYYASLELFAVNNSYAQDDWVRWGDANQTRASDMEGSELRFGWALDGRMNLQARLYLVDSITTVEDGKRFRVDFNFRF